MVRFFRDQQTVNIGTTSEQLIGPNDNRVTLVLSLPANRELDTTPVVAVVNDADANSLGVKQTYTAPAGRGAFDVGASMTIGAGAPTVQFRITTGGVTVIHSSYTAGTSGFFAVQLAGGDAVDWNVSTVGGVGSIIDTSIAVKEVRNLNRLTLSFIDDPTDGIGLVIYPGMRPLILSHTDFG